MPVYKSKNGTYFVRISLNKNGKRYQKIKRGFEKKGDATAWEAEYRSQDVTPVTQSFDDVMEAYLNYSEASPTSRYLKTTFITRHFPLHSAPINKITKEMLVEWRNTLKTGSLAVRTANRGMGYVRSVFSYASEVYGIKNAGTVLKSFKLTKEDKKEMQTWSPDEFNKFISEVPEGYYKAYFTLLYWSGLRRSEGLAVCKDDFDGRVLHVHRSIKHFKNGFLPLKTDSSERYITIDKTTYEYLLPYIQDGSPFVFGGERSLPITNVQREFARAIEASGVKKIRIHDLRHSHASFLLGNNVPPVAVRSRLGHATLSQTLSTYAHLLKEPHDAMMETIDEVRKKG